MLKYCLGLDNGPVRGGSSTDIVLPTATIADPTAVIYVTLYYDTGRRHKDYSLYNTVGLDVPPFLFAQAKNNFPSDRRAKITLLVVFSKTSNKF